MHPILIIFLFLPLLGWSQDTTHNYYLNRIQFDQNIAEVRSTVNADTFIIKNSKTAIAPCIFQFLTKLENSEFLIANPKESFNATDLVDNNLPDRQLISVFIGKTCTILEYAHGGDGFHYHIAWFELTNDSVTDYWVCNSINSIDDVKGLRNFINSFDRKIKLKNGKSVLPSVCF